MRKNWMLPLAIIMLVLTVSNALATFDAPVRYYPMDDENTFTTYTTDESGNDINGIFYNLTTYAIENATGQSYPGILGESYLFYENAGGMGSNDVFAIDTQYEPTGPYAVSFWFKPLWPDASGQSLIEASNGGDSLTLFANPAEIFMCDNPSVCDTYLYRYDLDYSSQVNTTSFHHMLFQYTGENANDSDLELFINGVKQTGWTNDGTPTFNESAFSWEGATLTIGSILFNGGPAAYIDEFRIYDGEFFDEAGVEQIIDLTLNPCTPDWTCTGYGACVEETQTQPCNSVVDLNLCGEPYTGNYSEFTPQACYAPGAYESADLGRITIDGIASVFVTIVGLASLVGLVLIAGWLRKKI